MGFWETVLATFVGGLLLLLVPWVRHRLLDAWRWLGSQEATTAKAKEVIASQDSAARRARVAEVARAKGIRLPVTATGRNPTVITWSDGSKNWFYSDRRRYDHDMLNHKTDPLRSNPFPFRGNPVSGWPDVKVRDWLAQHDH